MKHDKIEKRCTAMLTKFIINNIDHITLIKRFKTFVKNTQWVQKGLRDKMAVKDAKV